MDYTLTGPNGVVPNNTIQNMTIDDSGTYTFSYVIKETTLARNLAIAGFSSEQNSEREVALASNVYDGNQGTFWHTRWDPEPVAVYPHFIDLDLGEEANISGLEYLPRQGTGAEMNGTIERYEIFVSNTTAEGQWGDAVKTGIWAYDTVLKEVEFPIKSGRYLRLEAKPNPDEPTRLWASAAEIRVITADIVNCEKTITINVQKPQTYVYNNGWEDNEDPSGISKLIDTLEIRSGDAVISSNTLINEIIVNPGASLTINENVIMTYKTVNLKSTSTTFASLIDKGWMASEVSYNRHVNILGTSQGGGNDLISSPVTGISFDNNFVVANKNLGEHPDKNGIYAFAPYDLSTGNYENFNIGADKSGRIPIVTGSGYRAATTNDSTLVFKGQITRNPVNIAISDIGSAWNLIGNPYPAYLHFRAFFDANSNQFESGEAYQAIYGYNGGATDKWEVLNFATAYDNYLIAPGQGFFVKAQSGGGNVRFLPDMRRAGNSDDFVPNRAGNSNKALSKLKLSRGPNVVSTSIYFIEGTTRGLDPGYDAGAFTGAKTDFSLFTNLLEDDKGHEIAIQSLPYDDFKNVIVPLGIKARAGAELSINIDELSTIPSYINVYLEDTQYNTLTLLNKDVFKFTPSLDLNSADRFNVHYSSKTLSTNDLQSDKDLRIYINTMPKVLFIIGQLTSKTTAHLYDIQGRLVSSKVLNLNSTENTMDISTISTGVYVIKVASDDQVKTQKLVIK